MGGGFEVAVARGGGGAAEWRRRGVSATCAWGEFGGGLMLLAVIRRWEALEELLMVGTKFLAEDSARSTRRGESERGAGGVSAGSVVGVDKFVRGIVVFLWDCWGVGDDGGFGLWTADGRGFVLKEGGDGGHFFGVFFDAF